MGINYDIMDDVRAHPALYMGSKSIKVLQAFLNGASYASFKLNADDSDEFSPIPFRFFNDYVAHFYNYYESTSGWMNMILNMNYYDEELSFDTFYMLLDKFRSIKIIQRQKCNLTLEHKRYYNENENATKLLVPPDYKLQEPLFIDSKAIYVIELYDESGYLCMVECSNTNYLNGTLFKNRQSAIQYFKKNFGGSFRWQTVENIPKKFDCL